MSIASKPQLRYPGQVKDKATRETLVNYKERIENVATCVDQNTTDNTNQNVLIQQLLTTVASLQTQINNVSSTTAAGSDFSPTGSIHMYGAATAPDGYLLCDGSAVSRTQYNILYGVIGTTYGVGDGSTTFNLPDFKDRYAIGDSTTLTLGGTLGSNSYDISHTHTANGDLQAVSVSPGSTGGPDATTTVDNNLDGSTIAVASSIHVHISPTHQHDVEGSTSGGVWTDTTINADDTAVDLRPESLVVNFIIKT